MIFLNDITFGYPESPPIFAGFNWQIEPGKNWAVLGPSGCGKSTLLYLIAGLLFPTDGQILIDEEVISGPRPRTGLILQDYGLLPWATARQNIRLGVDIRRFYGPDGKHSPEDFDSQAYESRAEHWIDRLGLSPHIDKYPGQLSGGQRQRVAVARTLALDPDLLLMDEPFSSLDDPTRAKLQDQTLALSREEDLTLVIVTHNIEEAAVLGENILLLKQPTHQQAIVMDNPHVWQPDYRQSAEYFQLCQSLREIMDADS